MTENAYKRILAAMDRATTLHQEPSYRGADEFWLLVGMVAGAVEKSMPPGSDSYAIALLLRRTPTWAAGGDSAYHLLMVLRGTFQREQYVVVDAATGEPRELR